MLGAQFLRSITVPRQCPGRRSDGHTVRRDSRADHVPLPDLVAAGDHSPMRIPAVQARSRGWDVSSRVGEEMKSAESELKWFQFRQRLIQWRNRQTQDQLDAVERSEERLVSILQKRYGYTRLQARSELHKHYSKARLE